MVSINGTSVHNCGTPPSLKQICKLPTDWKAPDNLVLSTLDERTQKFPSSTMIQASYNNPCEGRLNCIFIKF